MDEADRSKLQSNRRFLVKNIADVDEVIEGLFIKKVITDGMKQEIEAEKTKDKKLRTMLDIIPRRGPTAYKQFLQVLVESSNGFVANRLEPGFCTNSPAMRSLSQPVQESAMPEEKPLPDKWPCAEHCITKDFIVEKCQCSADITQKWNDFTNNYKMKNSPRGRAMIINNFNFKILKERDAEGKLKTKLSLQPRYGSDKDEEAMENLFKQLHFDVETHSDQTSKQMLEIIKTEKSKPIHRKAECFVLVIQTHGSKEGLFGHDSQIVKLAEITTLLDGQSWPQMKDKPKLLFLQACRGDTYDRGSVADNAKSVLPDAMGKMSLESEVGGRIIEPLIPTNAHFLTVQATTADLVSFCNIELGSWLIQAVVFVFRNYAHVDDVDTMLTKVSNLVAKGRAQRDQTQPVSVAVSEKTSTLTKKLYFFPGLQEISAEIEQNETSSNISQPTDG